MTKTVGILLFNDVEVLDFAGPFEAFSACITSGGNEFFEVFTLAESVDTIHCRNGLKVLPDYSLQAHPRIDILILPGGEGSKVAMLSTDLIAWIKQVSLSSEYTASICSGARLMAVAGLLDGLNITTHHTVVSDLQALVPTAIVDTNKRFIGNGKYYTAGGISSGIDLSLHLIEEIAGTAASHRVQVYMEYGDWQKKKN